MSIFKDSLADDMSVFFNVEEMAEQHTVTTYDSDKSRKDQIVPMIVEAFTLDGRPVQHAQGVSVHNLVLFVQEGVLSFRPRVDQEFFLDYMKYIVIDVADEVGMIKIALQRNGTRP